MNIYEADETIKALFPDKNYDLVFDSNCISQIEIEFTNGKLREKHHVEFVKVLVMVDGEPEQYLHISPHRNLFALEDIKKDFDIDIHVDLFGISPRRSET